MTKRVAILATGIFSPLSSAVELATRARAAGYEVAFFAPASSAKLLDFSGFVHHKIPRPKVHTFAPLLPPPEGKILNAQQRQDRLDAAVSALKADSLEDLISRIKPDIVMVDCEMHAHIIIALSLGLPVVQYTSMYLSPPGLQAPPLHKRAYPGHGLRGSKLAVLATWLFYLLRKSIKIRQNARKDQGADHPTALTELARRRGIPLKKLRRLACWQMPWTYKIPTALLLPKSLDLPTRPYDNMTYLGPMALQSRPEIEEKSDKIRDFCTETDGTKRIFIGFGSMMAPDSKLLARLWKIAARRPEWRFLCAAGDHWDSDTLQNLPQNVTVVRWVPQQLVLEHTDLAILHGGTGSLVEAAMAATPVLIFPHVNDQKGSAARALFHGIGRACRVSDPASRIEAEMVDLLYGTDVAENCKIIQQRCLAERDASDVGTFLSKFVGESV